MIKLSLEQIEKIKAYCIEQFPLEAVIGVANNELVFLKNLSKTPQEDFLVDFSVENLQALIHSHPKGTTDPSQMDMKGQIATDIPWGIVSVQQNNDGLTVSNISWFGDEVSLYTPLLGRQFKHGVLDCYSAIRGFYAQTPDQILESFGHSGRECREYLQNKPVVKLKEFARDMLWWERGDNLYVNGFAEAGFKQVFLEDLKAGDVILYKIKSSVLNHGAVFLGDGVIYHHLHNRISARETFGHWEKFANLFLRYVENS